MKSKILALSAISAGFISLFLTLGAYFEIVDLFMVVTASIFVLLPLYYKSYKGAFLVFLAGGTIAILCSGFNFSLVFPAYFLFFGLYPIIKIIMINKNVKKCLCIIIGLVWIISASYLCYFYYTLILNGIFEGLPTWLEDYIIYGVGIISIVFFFIYDRFIVIFYVNMRKYLSKILK